MGTFSIKRRDFIKYTPFVLGGVYLNPSTVWSKNTTKDLIQKKISSTSQSIPAIGMGTWITFNVGSSQKLRQARTQVLKTFFDLGGAVVDSSPMYGSSQEVLGYALKKLSYPDQLFAADKIWTSSSANSRPQFLETKNKWGVEDFELMQVHNLKNWKGHIDFLKEAKKQNKIKYIGVTTSHGRRHKELETVIKTQDIDFVQLTYNITHKKAENRLLKMAQDKGISVIANRPYDGGQLMETYKAQPLPGVAKEAGIKTWAELFLKWIISHPAMTVAIPATSKVSHMKENMNVLKGPLFDQKLREELAKAFA